MRRNTHLPKSAYLKDAAVVELLRDEIAEQIAERGNFKPGAKITVDFFYDKRDGTYGVESYVDKEIYDIAHGTTLLDAIDSAMGEHDVQELEENPHSWVRDEETWDRAKEQVQPYWDEYDDPWAVVTTVYKQMGGEVR